MALKKAIEMNTGTVAEYWRIGVMVWSYPARLEIRVNGFVSEAAAKQGKACLEEKIVSLQDSEPLTRAQVYIVVKSHPEFQGAEDC